MAAFNFPASPSNGDTYTLNSVTYQYDGTKWVRYSAAVGAQGSTGSTGAQGAQGSQGHQGLQGAQAHISTSAPSSGVNNGDLWWESDTGDLAIYYNDGSSAQWIDINTGPRGAQGGTGPTGAQGAQGHQGHQGATGSGAQGAVGSQGAAGAQGATGPTGAQGTAGSNASISNNTDNRIITGGSGTNLNGEQYLTYDGNKFTTSDTTSGISGTETTTAEFRRDDGTRNPRIQINHNQEGSIIHHTYSTGASNLMFSVGSDEKLRITNAGDVGIGDNNPGIRLTVIDSGTENLVRLGRSDASSHGSHTINIKASKDYYHNFKMEASSYNLDCYNGSSMIDAFNITSTGVQVPTTTQSTLTSNGALIVSGGVGVAKNIICGGQLEVQNNTLVVTASAPNILMSVPSGGLDSRIYNDGSGNFYIGHGTNSSAPTERLHIDSAGDVIFKNNGGDNRIERDTTSGGPYLLFHNRGINTTDNSGVYNLGGISAAGYRDVANPGIVGSIQFERAPTAGGLSSGCNIVFRTGFNGGTSHTGMSERLRLTYEGHLLPGANNTYDLGSTAKRWRNVYTTDLQLSNKGKTNDVDNTWGDYTIQEGESDLFLINNRNGKKYKFNLTEVS